MAVKIVKQKSYKQGSDQLCSKGHMKRDSRILSDDRMTDLVPLSPPDNCNNNNKEPGFVNDSSYRR